MNQSHSRRAFVFGFVAISGWTELFGIPMADARQPTAPRRIGVLLAASLPEEKVPQAFRQGLLDEGYVEGRDVVIEWRSANGDYSRVPQLAADLVKSKVEVIVVESTPAAEAVKRATSTIPIVLAVVADPIARGLASSFAHPGGNITGLSAMAEDLSAKRLQLLKEALPRLTIVAILWNPNNAFHTQVIEQLNAAAPSLSIKLHIVPARTPEEFDAAFSVMRRGHAQALYVIQDALFFTKRMKLLELASKERLPIVYWVKEFAEDGGLMSYGPSYEDLMRRSAGYVDKILKGAKPGDLPIEQPAKFDLVVNLKAAEALGITIPLSILVRADEVIR